MNHTESHSGHLTDEEAIEWVEAVNHGTFKDIPVNLKEHVEECTECQARIIEISQVIEETDNIDLENESNRQRNTTKRIFLAKPTRGPLSIAAAVILLLAIAGIVYLIVPANQKPDPNELFAANFKPYPDILTEKGSPRISDTTQVLLHLGLNYYHLGKFDSAAMIFRHLLKASTGNDTVSFYLATSLLAVQKVPDDPVEIFAMLSEKQSIFSDPARWYLALAYLKKHDLEKANAQLKILSSLPGSYHDKAEKLLSTMEKR